ncbi:hypothetical protein [Bacillus licheniformis]|uniref:DUF6941 family protein n=1 Tax=Bacillus TaxID=1386 RepID=UPI000BA6D485|nr:hypothetical protein [Bacillus licheniformis]MBU8564515.1 hypothetical protein [Bacillus licheniformis]MDE1366154.1 hypothetical protein [Bacillus licheniformis]MDE1432707.1 hypothetical protein [Bacillus licheniformis]MDE1434719.1 hypothetical protein [Bacillus licheniformis]MEC1244869.1 hypothetical protein [Bacillus licheniformis]
MFNIGYAVICENAFNDGKQIIIKNPYSIISPVNIPSNFSFNLAFSIIKVPAPTDEADAALLQFRLKDPDGNDIVISDALTIKVGNQEEDSQKYMYGDANFNFSNIEFLKEGNYNLEMHLEGRCKKTIEIPVIKRDHLKE